MVNGQSRQQGVILNALGLSHQYAAKLIQPGDRAVDATAGNGGDTCFLAELVGSSGHVDAFDIQPAALDKTRQRLASAGLAARCTLHLASHDQMADLVAPGVRVIMFNLGYLPGGDHQIGTRASSTLRAVEQAQNLLLPGGIITIGIYYGGDSGFAERDAVLEYLPSIDVHAFAVQKIEMANAANCAPIFICIEKFAGRI
jgi:predicted methyltransferase